MKIEKNKIVFGMVLLAVVVFIVSYTMYVMEEDVEVNSRLDQTMVPDLGEEQNQYKSKLDAVNDLKKVRETNAPSMYDEKLIDSLGFYDPDLPEKSKLRIVDSIYKAHRINYPDSQKTPRTTTKREEQLRNIPDSAELQIQEKVSLKEFGLEQQLFFAANPRENEEHLTSLISHNIEVVVDGDQLVTNKSRIRMRLVSDIDLYGRVIPKNSPIYGFVTIQPNRVLIKIEKVQSTPQDLNAYDLQDGSEGIYVENNLRAEATNEILDDVISDINVPSIPQIGGITKVLKRNNRNIKVTILNNYRLILKPKS